MSARPKVAVTLTQRWHAVPGGTATSIERLLSILGPRGQFDFVGVEPRGHLRHPKSLTRPVTRFPNPVGLTSTHLPLPLPVLYDSWRFTGRPRISAAAPGVDLLHLTVPVVPPQGPEPLIATIHDLFPLTHPHLLTPRGVSLMRSGIEAIRKRALRVMVPTEFVAAEFLSHGFDPERLRVVPLGVSPVSLDPVETRKVLDKYGVRGPFVLFVGTLEPRKNVRGLLQAMIRLSRPEVTLVLVGPRGWAGALERDDVQMDDVPSPVVTLGYLPAADLAHLEFAADAFCYPSLAEGFGMPVLEAMAAGAAVVTSAGTASQEVAGDAALLVDPTSPDEIATALASLLDDPSAAASLRTRARERSGKFSWERTADLVSAVYGEVLG